MTDRQSHEPAMIADPAVPQYVYDSDYYLKTCAGHIEWRQSHGTNASGIYAGALALAEFKAGETLIDIGTGRGELLAVAVDQGSPNAIGIEYSDAALGLARTTIEAHGVGDRARVLHADARAIPLPDGEADLVTLLDVVEHLIPEELDRTLGEAFRLLRPGGRLLIHTIPTRTLYDVTYSWQRRLRSGRRHNWPADPRAEIERVMHVNEQTFSGLRKSLRRAGFRPSGVRCGRWIFTDFVPDERAKTTYHRLARVPFLRRLAIADLWALARKPA